MKSVVAGEPHQQSTALIRIMSQPPKEPAKAPVSKVQDGALSAKRLENLALVGKNPDLVVKNNWMETESMWKSELGTVAKVATNSPNKMSARSKNHVEGANKVGAVMKKFSGQTINNKKVKK